MNIAGFQKISLLDYPGTPCAIIFTQGCSFRCHFCHNPELIPMEAPAMISEDEVIEALEKHKKMVNAVTITGGEPTLHADLPEFIAKLKDKGYLVKLDTNGVTPAMVKDLIGRRLVDYIAMDLKQRWEKYDEVINVNSPALVDRSRETFGIIQDSGVDHEFRTTILPGSHTPDDFMAMAGYLKPGEKYFIQETRFDVMLDPAVARETGFDVAKLVADLKTAYPRVFIDKR